MGAVFLDGELGELLGVEVDPANVAGVGDERVLAGRGDRQRAHVVGRRFTSRPTLVTAAAGSASAAGAVVKGRRVALGVTLALMLIIMI